MAHFPSDYMLDALRVDPGLMFRQPSARPIGLALGGHEFPAPLVIGGRAPD